MLRRAAFLALILAQVIACAPPPEPVRIPPYPESWTWDPFLDTLQTRTLTFFLDTTPRATGSLRTAGRRRRRPAWRPSDMR